MNENLRAKLVFKIHSTTFHPIDRYLWRRKNYTHNFEIKGIFFGTLILPINIQTHYWNKSFCNLQLCSEVRPSHVSMFLLFSTHLICLWLLIISTYCVNIYCRFERNSSRQLGPVGSCEASTALQQFEVVRSPGEFKISAFSQESGQEQ